MNQILFMESAHLKPTELLNQISPAIFPTYSVFC